MFPDCLTIVYMLIVFILYVAQTHVSDYNQLRISFLGMILTIQTLSQQILIPVYHQSTIHHAAH